MTVKEELVEARATIAKLHADLAEANATITELRAEVARLRGELKRSNEEAREAARQAARFRRPESKKIRPEDKKPCGRKAGHRGAYRAEPQHVDHHVEQKLDCCPNCTGPLTDRRSLTQFIEELPPIRPIVTRLVTWSGRCAQCGDVRSTHPLQTSLAQGSAGNMLGPRAAALAVWLNKHHGVTQRKTCRIFKEGFGLSLTSGGLSQLLDRAARKMQDKYDQLIEEIRGSRAVHVDETSWYVGRAGYWLWVFSTPSITVYRIASSRGHPVAKEVLGDAFDQVLISDCAAMYDKFDCPRHLCIAHHQKAIKEQRASAPASSYLHVCASFFRDVVELAHARADLPPEEFAKRDAEIRKRAERLLHQYVTEPQDCKIQNRLKRCGEGLLGCLTYGVDPTNNLAERDLRPAVISRKVSCGNKTTSGAKTSEILQSLAATAHKQGQDFVSNVAAAIRVSSTAPVR